MNGGPENLGTASRDKEKSTANKLCNWQSKIFEKKVIHLITLELKHVINHYDVRRGVCATSLSAKERRSFAKNSRDIKQVWTRENSDLCIKYSQQNKSK